MKEYCKSCKRFSPGLRTGETCSRCKLTEAQQTGVQTIHVKPVTVDGYTGFFSADGKAEGNQTLQIVFPDITYTVRYVASDPNATHLLTSDKYLHHAAYEGPGSALAGFQMCLNWIVNTRNSARWGELQRTCKI